jgi:hypothetical protein
VLALGACGAQGRGQLREAAAGPRRLEPAGSANVWITDDEAGTQAVIDQEEEFARLDPADSVTPVEDKVVQSGNAIAVVSSDSSPDYRPTIEECIPPPS